MRANSTGADPTGADPTGTGTVRADFARGGSDAPTVDELRLPREPGVMRRFWARHPRLADRLVVTVFALIQTPLLIGGLVAGSIGGSLGEQLWSTGVQLVLCVLAGAALLRRRQQPVVAVIVTGLATAVTPLLPGLSAGAAIVALMVALYSVAVHRSTREAWRCFGIATAVLTLVAWFESRAELAEWLGSAIMTALVLVIAVLIGANIGSKRRYVAALLDRAAQLARERDQQARLAAAAERNRIASELHDIVAHGLSVMVRLADGAEAIADQDPAAARSAVHSIGATGRASLAEMRRLMGVLRDDGPPGPVVTGPLNGASLDAGSLIAERSGAGPLSAGASDDAVPPIAGPLIAGPVVDETADAAASAERTDPPREPQCDPLHGPQLAQQLAPQPTIGELLALVDRCRAAGLPVVLETTGVIPTAEGVQLTVYRAVQEGLTNVLRYARSPSRVVARVVSSGDGGVVVEVVDDGQEGEAAASVGAGRGLIGMAERAALYGGIVTSGPLATGGWRMRMTLPQARDEQPAGGAV